MTTTSSTKTFDLQTPSGLILKLRFDIRRLHDASGTLDVRYAAIDCAVDAWHLVDWVLQFVNDERHIELSGVERHKHGAAEGFLKKNSARLPDLRQIQVIANTGKHRALRKGDDPTFKTFTTVVFNPPFNASSPESWANMKIRPAAYIECEEGRIDVLHFFQRIERAWRLVLVEEGLLGSELAGCEINYGHPSGSMDDEDQAVGER